MDPDVYEPVADDLTHQEPAISTRYLKKTFFDAFGQAEVKAVDGVSLDIYEGEVFCLLGHNGAGKTTMIGMLTGLLEITEGDAFICGHNVKTQMRAIRKILGVCPQHDVLWPRLTCQEHLELFALLKGVPRARVREEAKKTLTAVGLEEKEHDFPSHMSGGQKRKLSLGIALIGGSKVMFLDEPTSGMDPESRRATWNLIEHEKKNRAIVLTTHFMDEADILGDRIAIMSTGDVRCCGSPLFLKQKFGVGYTFVVSLEAGIKPAVIRPDIDAIVLRSVRGASLFSIAGGEIAYRLPFAEANSFPDMFEALDAQRKRLRITGYGVSVTTLEEVFMKIGTDFGDLHQNQSSNKSQPKMDATDIAVVSQAQHDKDNNDGKGDDGDDTKDDGDVKEDANEKDFFNRHHHNGDDEDKENLANIFAQPTFRLQQQQELSVLLTHTWAILYKRFWWSVRDFRAMFFVIILPCLLVALNFGLQNLGLAIDYPNLVLNVDQWLV
ncbi:hypothetical protein RFI_09505 [Reticulomyxa filosa]|uniref:ABC transporter domain-containing protein n=1 Tax=Reticulomyxa filosa TaxID=46433 RepID=X6NNP1_RETFI|nr:hypothetical protein RFI_09505 [Reticulomyxa filosa]|eukprot:ETO27626.1 hypothetical protein RFI_09505 [Reticulomyxa filosa]